jgi:hypothetical protein
VQQTERRCLDEGAVTVREDRTNNEELNLLPLCPSCHLTDLHDPTAPVDRLKLRLFREYRDISILAPEFHPIFRRLRFVLDPESLQSVDEAHTQVTDLIAFLHQFDKGQYYHVQVNELLTVRPYREWVASLDEPDGAHAARKRDHDERELARFKRAVAEQRAKVMGFVVEMLTYQPWAERFAERVRRGRK